MSKVIIACYGIIVAVVSCKDHVWILIQNAISFCRVIYCLSVSRDESQMLLNIVFSK